APPSAFTALAQCQCRDTVRQCRHDLATFPGGQPKPAADFAARESAADTETGFRIDHADLDTGRFYFLRRERIHDGQDKLVWQCSRHGSGIVVLENAMRRNGFPS